MRRQTCLRGSASVVVVLLLSAHSALSLSLERGLRVLEDVDDDPRKLEKVAAKLEEDEEENPATFKLGQGKLKLSRLQVNGDYKRFIARCQVPKEVLKMNITKDNGEMKRLEVEFEKVTEGSVNGDPIFAAHRHFDIGFATDAAPGVRMKKLFEFWKTRSPFGRKDEKSCIYNPRGVQESSAEKKAQREIDKEDPFDRHPEPQVRSSTLIVLCGLHIKSFAIYKGVEEE